MFNKKLMILALGLYAYSNLSAMKNNNDLKNNPFLSDQNEFVLETDPNKFNEENINIEDFFEEPKTPEQGTIENNNDYTPTKDRNLNILFQLIFLGDSILFAQHLNKNEVNKNEADLHKIILDGPYKDTSAYSYILENGLIDFLEALYQTKHIRPSQIQEILQRNKTKNTLHINTKNWMKYKLSVRRENLAYIIDNKIKKRKFLEKVSQGISQKAINIVTQNIRIINQEQRANALYDTLEQKKSPQGKTFVMLPFLGLVTEENLAILQK